MLFEHYDPAMTVIDFLDFNYVTQITILPQSLLK